MPPELIVAITIWLEARGEPLAGKLAVASVLVNRAETRGTSLDREALRRRQFSCWNDGGQTARRLWAAGAMRGPAWADCQRIARQAIAGTLPLRTHWTHFYAPRRVKSKPKWAKNMRGARKIGNHIFGSLKK